MLVVYIIAALVLLAIGALNVHASESATTRRRFYSHMLAFLLCQMGLLFQLVEIVAIILPPHRSCP